MAEYIDKGKAISIVEKFGCNNGSCIGKHSGVADVIASLISDLTAADVAPVRHGRWIASHDEFCACSICKYPVYVGWNQTNYCPNCGAKMDLE